MIDDIIATAVPNGAGGLYIPPRKPAVPLPSDIPPCDPKDPASLEAWHGPYGFFDHYRKVVLADACEIVRAKGALDGEKLTESRIDQLARRSDLYLSFLAEHLDARTERHRFVRQDVGA